MGMTLKKCLFSNIRLECGLRLAPLRMQRGTQLLRSSFPRRCGVCVTYTTTDGGGLGKARSGQRGPSPHRS